MTHLASNIHVHVILDIKIHAIRSPFQWIETNSSRTMLAPFHPFTLSPIYVLFGTKILRTVVFFFTHLICFSLQTQGCQTNWKFCRRCECVFLSVHVTAVIHCYQSRFNLPPTPCVLQHVPTPCIPEHVSRYGNEEILSVLSQTKLDLHLISARPSRPTLTLPQLHFNGSWIDCYTRLPSQVLTRSLLVLSNYYRSSDLCSTLLSAKYAPVSCHYHSTCAWNYHPNPPPQHY